MSNTKYPKTFSIRVTEEMQNMLTYLEQKKLLNQTSTIRLAVSELYRNEKLKERQGDNYENT